MCEKAVIGICHGPRCGDYGGIELAKKLVSKGIAFEILPCQSLCPHGPIARLHGIAKLRAKISDIVHVVKSKAN